MIYKKITIASGVSPLAILLIPVVVSIFVAHSPTVDSMDDAPKRAAGIILFVLTPIAYPILSVAIFVSTWVLEKLHLFSKWSVAALVIITSIICGVLLGLRSPFGVKDQLIGITLFFILFLVCLGLGATVWWAIAKPRHI